MNPPKPQIEKGKEPEDLDDDESIDDFIRKHLNESKESSAEKSKETNGKNSPAFKEPNYDSLSDSDSDSKDGES